LDDGAPPPALPATKFVSRGLVRGSVVGRVLPRALGYTDTVASMQREPSSTPAGGTIADPTLFARHTIEVTPLTTEGALAVKPRTDLDRATEARIRGYEGEACRECGNFTLVRNGTCLKCDTCGGTSGCS
jgi:ribonucleoside-diphosphate reductase alpha chain